MECGCAVQGYRDERCRERGLCGLTAQDKLRNLADALVEDIMAMSDEEILAETTPRRRFCAGCCAPTSSVDKRTTEPNK